MSAQVDLAAGAPPDRGADAQKYRLMSQQTPPPSTSLIHLSTDSPVELFSVGEKICAAGKALAARRVAESGSWRRSGDRSAAHWLARRSGSSVGQAAGTLEAIDQIAIASSRLVERDGRGV